MIRKNNFFLQVDGDTDTAHVQQDFNNVVKQHLEFLKNYKTTNMPPQLNHALPSNNAVLNNVNVNKNGAPRVQNGGLPNGGIMQNGGAHNGGVQNGGVRQHNNLNGQLPNDTEATLHDLEAVAELETISRRVQGNIQNGVNNFRGMPNGQMPNGTAVGNGFVPGDKFRDLDQQRREHIRNMYQGIPLDSHI